MIRYLILAAFLTFAGASVTYSQESEAPEDVSKLSGEKSFHYYCSACHGEDAKGTGTASEDLTQAPLDLTELSARNNGVFPRERVIRIIDGRDEVKAHGPRDMPTWGEWFKDEAAEGLGQAEGSESEIRRRIDLLVDYLESLQAS